MQLETLFKKKTFLELTDLHFKCFTQGTGRIALKRKGISWNFFFHRVSLDPKAQKVVGVLRYYLSQFSPKYRRGSTTDDNPPEALQKPLAQ